MKSATVDAKVRVESRGANARAGTVAARLTGAFASQGAKKLPKFAFKAEMTSAGRTVAGGATFTGEKAYVAMQGTAYEISDLLVRQFVAGYEQALKSQRSSRAGSSSARSAWTSAVAEELAQPGRGAGR